MDVFFMPLVDLKHMGQSNFLGKMFNLKRPSFERAITGSIDKIFTFDYDEFIQKNLNYFTFEELND